MEYTLHFDVTEQATVCTDSDNSFLIPFLCALTNIITLKPSLKEYRLVGYEYVNEKAGKEWCSTYEVGDLMCNLEYWPEQYMEE
jgi:hypothetical protein